MALRFYSVPGSLYCQQAEGLLRSAEVGFDKVELTSQHQLSAVARDLGVSKLPVLVGGGVLCEGLRQISEFVRSNNGTGGAPCR